MRRTSWFKGWRLGLIAALLIGGGWWVRQHYFTPPPAPQVITAPVTRQDLEDTVLATGSIQAIQQVDIGAQASGQIRKLHVELGQSIHKGDLVAEIDSTKQQNDLRNAEAQLAVLAAQKRSRQAQLVQYELALQRTKALVKEDAGTRADLEAAQASVDTTRAALAELDAQIEQARIAVDTARTNLGYTRIVAPMDGVVIAVVRKAGQTVNALQSAPTLIKLAQLDTMLIRAQISEADVVKVRPDMPVYFTIMGEPDKRYDARLVAIEPSTDAEQAETSSTTSTSSTSSSTTSAIYYNGRFTVPNPEHKLRIDMTAQVSIVASRADNTLTVPATALGARGKDGRYTVKVLEGEAGQAQRVSQRQVRVGLNNRVQAQVLDGLKEGERVVIGDASANNASRSRGGPPMF